MSKVKKTWGNNSTCVQLFDLHCADPMFRAYVEQVQAWWGKVEPEQKAEVFRHYSLEKTPQECVQCLMAQGMGCYVDLEVEVLEVDRHVPVFNAPRWSL